MAEIIKIDPTTFELQSYKGSDTSLVSQFPISKNFNNSSYIEFFIYDLNKNLLDFNLNYNRYKVFNDGVASSENGTISNFNISPSSDVTQKGYTQGQYIAFYNFLQKQIGDPTRNLYITEISSDKTEIRLDSNILSNLDIIDQANNFIQFRENQNYFVDFYLNFGNNNLVIANNIKLENKETDNPTILIKLYEPLPFNFNIKSELWVVTTLNEPEAFQVTYPIESIPFNDFTQISGPNFSIPVKNEVNNSSQNLSYNDIITGASTGSQNQIDSLLSQSAINISVDYNNFSDFINFSSAQTRIENFYYKVGLIESYNSQSNNLLEVTGSSTSRVIFQNKISNVINNFDKFEYFMYYNSGSMVSYPKSTTEPPYNLMSTGSAEVLTWLGSTNENNSNFGGLLLSASDFDNANPNELKKSIPEYLREDPANQQYDLFVDMVAQYYDNVWLYTKDITQKYNADNRLDFGVSKDLVADAIRDFGIKLYQNNFSNQELYTAFLGITPNGSLFPFPEITGSLPVSTGMEFIDTLISASNDVISMDDTNKSLYKRIYHNIPYLLKSKGTISGLRALITSYGIPDTILKISEFGGKDQVNANDYDLYFNNFNRALEVGPSINFISSSWRVNSKWESPDNRPSTVQFRFKSEEFPPTKTRQSLWNIYRPGGATAELLLDYNGSGSLSGSYSGSIKDPYYQYADLKFIPDHSTPSRSASISLPFYNGDWWSVMVVSGSEEFELYAGNKTYNGNDGTSIGYYSRDSIIGDNTVWSTGLTSNFALRENFREYPSFSGSLQEIRYYTTRISESVFKDYIMNPLSFEGNGINSAPNQLIFRAALGSELDIITTSSIHPKVTGSYNVTQSFTSNSNFYFNTDTPSYSKNTEYFFLDQPAVGIKNRITDKIRSESDTLPSGNVLSPIRRLSQTTEASASYTPNINYLEVAFSPQNQINDDIIGQMGHFNIGDYIGDPAQRFSGNIYPDLNNLSEEYFKKYIKQYDLVDFVRLIKFFDNSLFKMIKDFIPARTSLASGLVVKQHLLERNKYPQPQVNREEILLTGSIQSKQIWVESMSGSITSTSLIESFNGGAAGMFNPFNINYDGLTTVISGSNTFSYNWSTTAFDAVSETGLGDSAFLTVHQSGFTTNTDILKFLDFRDTTSENNPNLWLTYRSTPAVFPLFYFNTLNNNVSVARVQNIENIGNNSYRISLATGYGFASSIPQGNSEDKNGGVFSFVSSSLGTGNNFSETIPFTSSITNYNFETQPQFNVTQSWEVTEPTLSGSITYIHDSQDEFYNGELSGSTLIISNGELNEDCEQFKFINPRGGNYGIRSYNSTDDSFGDFINAQNLPLQGFIQTWFQEDNAFNPLPPPNPSS